MLVGGCIYRGKYRAAVNLGVFGLVVANRSSVIVILRNC